MILSSPEALDQEERPLPGNPDPPKTLAVIEKPALFLNPELSLLQFQRRVLEEALDTNTPLLERVKFLSILSSNLDEFFMVRVAGLMQQIESGVAERSVDGRIPSTQLSAIGAEYSSLVEDAYAAYREELIPALAASGIRVAAYKSLSAGQKSELEKCFRERIYPVLTPLAFDRGRPFPHISNLSLNLAIVVRDDAGAEHFARVKVPDTISQLVPVVEGAQKTVFVWLEELVIAHFICSFLGSKSQARTPSMSRATRKCRFRKSRPTTCSPLSKKPSGAAAFAT